MANDDGRFGETVAQRYDARSPASAQADFGAMIECLAALADGGAALEFAIGTGRVALPLAATGVKVSGIEMSRAMVRQLRDKPGAERIAVEIGDMTTVRVAGGFALVYLVFNTIDNLITQAAQVACFRNAAAHLDPGGRFVVETLVPPLQHLPFGQTLLAFARSDAHWGIDEIDVASQNYTSHHAWFDGSGPDLVPFRYAWPAEMDLMAQLAGLAPEHRWADWNRAPFDRFSRSHVSVWRKPT